MAAKILRYYNLRVVVFMVIRAFFLLWWPRQFLQIQDAESSVTTAATMIDDKVKMLQ